MSFEGYKERKESAEVSRKDGSFLESGHLYTAAAHEILGRANYAEEPLERGQVDTARGFSALQRASLCYRLAGDIARSRVRSKQGILLAEEIGEHVVRYDAQRGAMAEYIGDFRVICDAEDWDAAYDDAKRYYHTIDNEIGWLGEPEFEINLTFMLEVADAAEYDVDRNTKKDIQTDLTRRLSYKREHFPDMISHLLTRGEWPVR